MKNVLKIAATAPFMLALAACNGSSGTPGSAAAPATRAAGAGELEQPANTDFIGKVWVSTTPGSSRGSIIVFLPDRSVLQASCSQTFRLSKWGVVGDRIRWIEQSLPIEAEVVMPAKDVLQLRIVGVNRVQSYVTASVPYACPSPSPP